MKTLVSTDFQRVTFHMDEKAAFRTLGRQPQSGKHFYEKPFIGHLPNTQTSLNRSMSALRCWQQLRLSISGIVRNSLRMALGIPAS
jgi:hypothetical protein